MIHSARSGAQWLGVLFAAGLLACSSTTNDNGDATAQDSSPTDSGSGDGTASDSGAGDVADSGAGDSTTDSPGETSGDAPADTPTETSSAKAAHVSAAGDLGLGVGNTCLLMTDGTVRCWGRDDLGQAGGGTTDSCEGGAMQCVKTPTAVSGLSGVTKIVVGGDHTCALKSDKTVVCWGANDLGQLGTTTSDTCTPAGAFVAISCSHSPVAVTGITTATDIAVGGSHSCALLSDNTIKCWGSNDGGQLGVGSTAIDDCPDTVGASRPCSKTPISPSGLTDVTTVVAGAAHTCVLTNGATDPGAKCFGDNSAGEIGDGTTTARDVPTDVTGGGFVSLFGGATSGFTCGGMSGAGTVLDIQCWGDNSDRQIAGTGVTVPTPSSLSYISPDKTPTAFLGGNTTFVIQLDAMFAAGNNEKGQLGDGTTTTPTDHTAPTGFTFDKVSELGPGGEHTCAVMNDGSVMCWGANGSGQLGDGTTTDSLTPKTIAF